MLAVERRFLSPCSSFRIQCNWDATESACRGGRVPPYDLQLVVCSRVLQNGVSRFGAILALARAYKPGIGRPEKLDRPRNRTSRSGREPRFGFAQNFFFGILGAANSIPQIEKRLLLRWIHQCLRSKGLYTVTASTRESCKVAKFKFQHPYSIYTSWTTMISN
jgi:hypothetical protein